MCPPTRRRRSARHSPLAEQRAEPGRQAHPRILCVPSVHGNHGASGLGQGGWRGVGQQQGREAGRRLAAAPHRRQHPPAHFPANHPSHPCPAPPCPTLPACLQSDPVILATGHTYDRHSIERWLAQGHKTCPVTGMRLRHLELTPNFALRSAIADWAQANGVRLTERATHAAAQPVFKWDEDRAGNILHVGAARRLLLFV